jgi:hypothetical protein
MLRPENIPMPIRNNNDIFGPVDGSEADTPNTTPDTPAAIRQQGMTDQGITFSQDANATPPSGAFWGGQSDLSAGQYQEQTPAFYGPAPQQQAPDVVHFEDQQLPTLPDVPAHFDKTNPVHPTKLGMLLRVLAASGAGGMAGWGAKTPGEGFARGQAVGNNMQQMWSARDNAGVVAQRQQVADQRQQVQDQRQQVALGMDQAQRANYPQQQAQQQQLRGLQIAKLQDAPTDKHIQSYIGDDGTQRVVFQKANGDVYEKSLGGVQNTRVPPEPKPPKVIIMGRNTYHWDTNTDQWTLIGPAPEHQGTGADGKRRSPQSSFSKIETWKANELQKVEKHSGLDDPTALGYKQMIQNSYENMIRAAGGDVEHFDYATGGTQNQSNGPSAAPPTANVPPPGARIRDYTNLMPRVKRGR